MFYYVYVLKCSSSELQKLYIGYCKDLKERIKRHLKKEIRTTKKFDRINLIYYEACLSKKDAVKRETQLKTGFGRGYLKRRLKDYLNRRV